MKTEKNELAITEYESTQYNQIEEFKLEEPSVVSQALGYVFKPVSWMVETVIPKKALEGALVASDKIAELLTDKKDIIRDAQVVSIDELKHKDLALSDTLANEVHNWALGIAAAEGAATGAFGLPGLLVDIPSMITMSLRMIHKIGICYGYEAKNSFDEKFVMGILSAAGSNTMKEKSMSMAVLAEMNVVIAKTTWKKMIEQAASNPKNIQAGILAVKAVAKRLGVNITKRKAAQAIPIIGGAVGASMNASFINDVAWTARRMFQQRWLIENQKIIVVEEK